MKGNLKLMLGPLKTMLRSMGADEETDPKSEAAKRADRAFKAVGPELDKLGIREFIGIVIAAIDKNPDEAAVILDKLKSEL